MPSFGTNSTKHLSTCDPRIQEVLNEAIKHFDFSCIWGHRGQDDQNRAFREGNSQLEWPKSRHNTYPSKAVDVVPYPGGFSNTDETFYLLATYILSAANEVGVRLEWGGQWRTLRDLAHFELKTD